jgi:hypothetical protein
MTIYSDTWYKDNNNAIYFLSAGDLQRIVNGSPSPIKNSWVVITEEEAMAILNPPYNPTQEETVTNITNALQSALDAGAQAWGYNDIVTAASYAASSNVQYAADAQALIMWRDAVWSWALPLLPNIPLGETPQEFMVNMPQQPSQPITTE